MRFLENFKVQLAIVFVLEFIALLIAYYFGYTQIALWLALAVVINILIIVWIIYTYEKNRNKIDYDLSNALNDEAKEVFSFGDIGIVAYDETYTIISVNDFFKTRKIDLVGLRLSQWVPETKELFDGVESVDARIGDYFLEIHQVNGTQLLYVKDISEVEILKELTRDETVVAGLIQLDNYDDIQQYEDEATMALIGAQIRQLVLDWAKESGVLIRSLRQDRFYISTSFANFQQIEKNKFSILERVRKSAESMDQSITLSMCFASVNGDYVELDSVINDLLDLAKTRGGDQVAIKMLGEDVRYFGGNTQAVEKRSKVRVRVMAQALKEAIIDSDRVFIVGHRDMDFDCMSAMIATSRIATSNNVDSYIISRGLSKDYQLDSALNELWLELENRHNFVSEEEAIKLANTNDLIVVVDHNSPSQCSVENIFKTVKRVAVLDHHRRNEIIFENTILMYVETRASSTTELLTEILPFQKNKVDINEAEATLMYLGLLVDTNHFTNRTTSRTFEVASKLRQLGADPVTSQEYLKEEYVDFEEKSRILGSAQLHFDNIMIAKADDGEYSRTILSQCADEMLEIRGMEASFVIGRISDEEVAVSARSKSINVQLIMEAMNGGGHFNAAALQRKGSSVQEVYEELVAVIEQKKMEDVEDESNSTK